MFVSSHRSLILALLLLASWVRGQVIKFDRYTTSDGLSSDEVYNLYQDKDGFLWVFTNYGAHKYNGQIFKPVLRNLNVDEAFVFAFFEHRNGRKWVATSRANIYEVIRDSVFLVPGTEKVSATIRQHLHEIFSLHVDDSLNIFVVTKHDSYKFTRQNSGYSGKTLSVGASDSIAFRIYEMDHTTMSVHNFTGDDSTLCGGYDKLRIRAELKLDTFYQVVPCGISLPKHFKRFGKDVYFMHHDHLIKINKTENKRISLGRIPHNFTKDQNGHTWVATYQNGLLELDANDSVIHHYLQNITVNDVLYDSQGGLWASTSGFGLFHCPDLNHKYYDKPHQFSRPITLVRKISRGIVVANTAGDVYLMKPGTDQLQLIYRHPSGDLVSVAEQGDSLVMMFRFEVRCVRFKNGGTVEVPHPYRTRSVPIAVNHNGRVHFVQRKRISYLEGSNPVLWYTFRHRVFDLTFKESSAFVAMDVGLFEHSTEGKLVREIEQFRGIAVKKLIGTPQGELLCVAPGHGLFLFDGKQRIKRISKNEGLPSNFVNQVLFEPFGIILATPDGLYFSGQDSTANGLTNRTWNRFYTGSANHVVVADSNLLIGTVDGLVVMTKAQLKGHPGAHFHVGPLLVNGKETPASKLNDLDHHENNIEVHFDVVTFDKFRPVVHYRLTGPFSEEGVLNSSPLKLNHLPHGSYQLKIWPETPDQADQSVVRSFRIRPAYWETPLFIILAVLSSFFLLLMFFLAVNSYFRRKRDQKALAQNKLLEYKLIALKAQINPHFMSNCLSAIQHLIISNRVDEASDYIAKFGFLVRQILKYSDQSLISLKDEISLAKLFMDLEQLRFDRKLNYEVSIAPDIDPLKTMIPGLILNPIIENAIWHGLLPVKNERSCLIRIEARTRGGLIEVSVSDNGVGRSRIKSENKDRESKGEALIAQRLVNINLLLSTDECQVQYSDIYNNNKLEGTKVTLLLPQTFKTPING